MKRQSGLTWMVAGPLFAFLFGGAVSLLSNSRSAICAAPHRAYEQDLSFKPQFPFGQISAVAIASPHELIVLHRGRFPWAPGKEPPPSNIQEPLLILLDKRTGKQVRELGANLFRRPHGLSRDQDGNFWATDLLLHQVLKLSPEGNLLLALGEKEVSGNNAGHFDGPSDAATTKSGDVFVADGYGNRRIAVFSSDGHFKKSWTPSTRIGALNVPHSISASSELLYLVDRENARVLRLKSDGSFLGAFEIEGVPHPFAVSSHNDNEFVVVDGSRAERKTSPQAALVSPEGCVKTYFKPKGGFDGAHDIVVDENGDIYVAELHGARVLKFVSVSPTRREK